MSDINLISDDEDFVPEANTSDENVSTVLISTDDESIENFNQADENIISDDENTLPKVNMKKSRSAVIKSLFPKSDKNNFKSNTIHKFLKRTNNIDNKNVASGSKPITSIQSEPIEKVPGVDKMIGGVKVNLPVEPYGCQIALMSKMITAIKTSQNCLLESPTGTGKTLALLCSALAWHQAERIRIGKIQASDYFSQYPELKNAEHAADYISTPQKITPEKQFNIPIFGEKSIYDKPTTKEENSPCCVGKRQEPMWGDSQDSPENALVTIYAKRQRLNSNEPGEYANGLPSGALASTPEKTDKQASGDPDTPQHVSVPTIYYGARTHKQIQQVIKEFKRTIYCGEATMTVLSSREYSCLREFDKSQWGTKNDMCRGCIKPIKSAEAKSETNCSYYDNRSALNHRTLPPAFDLEDLVKAGEEKTACPYYAAKQMSNSAHIVFCPYNYLIEPSIRSSMQIELENNIVIIDEGHNIEDICRDAASLTVSLDSISAAIVELEKVALTRYSHDSIDNIMRTLKNWEYWFKNQLALLADKPVNNNEVSHMWQPEHFVQTLDNHNIGMKQFSEFKSSAETFCQRLRDDPRTLVGVTQATGTLIDSLSTVLGYLFRSSGEYLDDYAPALVKNVMMNSKYGTGHWRRSEFAQNVEKEKLELRLLCMNPAVVFEGVKAARCVVLASGTLTPLISLYSELATTFPIKVSPAHVIPKERVWVGSLGVCRRGHELLCRSKDTSNASVQDALGDALLVVARVTPHGVLCFVPSYRVMELLVDRWTETGVWEELKSLKHIFTESRNVRDHNEIMDDYYRYVETPKGAVLFAVFRGKVSEGMDFKDHQARAVVTIGIPYPNTYDMAVDAKMKYNDKFAKTRGLLPKSDWLLVQAYRALNQALGRCVRHRADWGAVLLLDARFRQTYYTKHLSGWVLDRLANNHHTFDSLVRGSNSLQAFMEHMSMSEDK